MHYPDYDALGDTPHGDEDPWLLVAADLLMQTYVAARLCATHARCWLGEQWRESGLPTLRRHTDRLRHLLPCHQAKA